MTRKRRQATPEDDQHHVITTVADHGDRLTFKYRGRAFSGIMVDQIPPVLTESFYPTTKVNARFEICFHLCESEPPLACLLPSRPADNDRAGHEREVFDDVLPFKRQAEGRIGEANVGQQDQRQRGSGHLQREQ